MADLLCEECGAPVVQSSRGEPTCQRCGLIAVSEVIDYSPVTQRGDEYLGVGGDGHGPGLNAPTAVAMTTAHGNPTRDASGRSLPLDAASRMRHLRQVDARVVSRQDRSAKRLADAVHDLALRLDTPLEERALVVARQAVEARAFPGWEFSLVAAGAMYFAMIEQSGYAKIGELAAAANTARPDAEKSLRVALKRIKRVVGVEPRRASAGEIARIAMESLGLPADMASLVRRNLDALPASPRPAIDAAAAIYMACEQSGIEMSQRRIADVVGTTDVSLRKRLQTRHTFSESGKIGIQRMNETWGKTPEAREAKRRGGLTSISKLSRENMIRGGRMSAKQGSSKYPTWPEVRFYGLVLGNPTTAAGFTAQQSDGHGIYDGAWIGQKIIAELDGGGHHAFKDRHADDSRKDIARMLDQNTVLREEDENVLFLKALSILSTKPSSTPAELVMT